MEYETQYDFFEGVDLYEDDSYLFYNLSYDAAPAIFAYDDEYDDHGYNSYNYKKNHYIDRITEDTENMGIRKFNLSKFIAKNMAQK